MKNIPFFTTENGVASLNLKEIPYKKTAYICIQSSENVKMLLKECVDFCTAVGAERIYAAAENGLDEFPVHASVLKMSIGKEQLPQTGAALFPVQERTAQQWQEIYNSRMQNVSHSTYLSESDVNTLIKQGEAYFVHRGDVLLGIGVISDDCIKSVISVIPGKGEDVLLSLCQGIFSEIISLEVASDNVPAMKLYKRLGFSPVCEVKKWYLVK